MYGDSVDKIVQGNTSNIVFLKSTDDSMLDTLQKMSGTTHRAFRESKNVTVDKGQIFMPVDNKVTYTYTVKEVPVISYNDMAFIPERNSIVFRAGDPPVWNRNETILPMSWRLFKNTIQHAGHDYTLQTIPTLSTVLDFDLRKNQPDFADILEKRMKQAYLSTVAQNAYKNAYCFSDFDIQRMDPDNYSDEIMSVINDLIKEESGLDENKVDLMDGIRDQIDNAVENTEVLQAAADAKVQLDKAEKKIYAGGLLSKNDLVGMGGQVSHRFDEEIVKIYMDLRNYFQSDKTFECRDGSLYSKDGELYIERVSTGDVEFCKKASEDPDRRVYAEDGETLLSNASDGYAVHDAFYKFLVSQDKWTFVNGRFESSMQKVMQS